MNQLRVRYHQLKIDMFALYQATMDSRGVKVHRVEHALSDIQAPGPSGNVLLRNEDQAYVQALSEMEKKITVGEHGRRRRHLLRKLNLPRASGEETAEVPRCSSEAARHEAGCRELDRHSNVTVLRCYRCTRRFDDKTGLFQHWRDEINCHIVCLFCREEFITNAKHDQHIRLCQALVCAQCKTQSHDYADYEHHVSVCQHAAKCEPVAVLAARVQCPYCDRLFTQIHMFKRHLKLMHEVEHMQRFGLKIQRKFRPNEREFPCRQCGRTFNRVYNLKIHQLSHGRHGQYRCETCNKTFRFRSNLDRHAHSHSSQQHACRVCGQEFRLLRQLRSHLNLEHDKDAFPCDVCQKSCQGYQRLMAHTRTHHSQQSYSCGVCGRTFATKHKYKEHMNVHEGRYTYECHLCSERFFTRDHLRKHYRKQHPEVKRVPRRASTRRATEPAHQPYFEPADLGPMINDTVTLYQASADSGEPSVVKFEVVGEQCRESAGPPYSADHTSQEMMDGGYQVYEGSAQHVLGEYNTVADGDAYNSAGPCQRAPHPEHYFQQQVDNAATLLNLDPVPPSVSDVPEGATVMTYIVPETSSHFSVQDSGWSNGLFGLQPLTTPEKTAPCSALFQPAAANPLFLTPDKPALTPSSMFMSPERCAPLRPSLLITPERDGRVHLGSPPATVVVPAAAAGPVAFGDASQAPALPYATNPQTVTPPYAASSQVEAPLYAPVPRAESSMYATGCQAALYAGGSRTEPPLCPSSGRPLSDFCCGGQPAPDQAGPSAAGDGDSSHQSAAAASRRHAAGHGSPRH